VSTGGSGWRKREHRNGEFSRRKSDGHRQVLIGGHVDETWCVNTDVDGNNVVVVRVEIV